MRPYRLLLLLYPASFRGEYGDEMTALVRHRLRDAGGPLARLVTWIGIAAETAVNAAAVHGEILKQDVRYTARTLNRARGFTLTAILIVALGVGANTAAFSVTDFVLLRPLPFPDPDRLVTLWQVQGGYARMELSPLNYHDWKQAASSFERLGVHTGITANLVGTGEPLRLKGAAVSGDLFPALGVRAALGRTFGGGEDLPVRASDADGPGGVVLSHGLWQRVFGGDAAIVGRTITLNDRPVTVIGVMPAGFSFPFSSVEFWVPLVVTPGDYQDRGNNYLYGIGRLKPGATIQSARAEMALVAARSQRDQPSPAETVSATVNGLRDELSRQSRVMVLALSGAALCVLLIVCANLANLLLARALGRRQEIAVRTAMGAGRERLIRQLATESIVLALLGGTLGVLLAVMVVPMLWRLVPANLPTSTAPGIDLRVLAFAGALSLAAALAAGLAPMIRSGDDTGARGLREGARAIGGRKEALRGALVVAEVIASVVLLIATGLLVRTLWTIQSTDPGFRADAVLTLRTDLPLPKYAVTARRTEFYTHVFEQVRALPGVSSASAISFLPMVMRGGVWPVGLPGEPADRRAGHTASLRFVAPGFFKTLDVPLRSGRDVADGDTATAQMVAVVSESFAARYWPGQDAIGRHFGFAFADRTIVGVVGDIRVRGLESTSEPQVYLPYAQQPDNSLVFYLPKDIVIRASTPLDQLVPAIRAIVHTADPQQPISDVRPMKEIVDAETASRGLQVRVLAGFAMVAFLLAAIGIHGVLSFAVSQRTAEIGVRIALGAQRRDILTMIARQGGALVAMGLLPGLLLASLAGRSLQALLVGVTPIDPLTFGAVTTLVILMAAAGTLLPAFRAVRIDPIRAIRAD
ncbi:MAG TPA: ABC transporter permease [Vicinamibacterales bacterium]|nr:ABC transporter permease [Vicinamibacterales bacterium]